MTVLDDHRLQSPAPLRRIALGDLTITYVPDGFTTLDARTWFPDSTDEFWSEHSAYVTEGGALTASVGGLLVQHGTRAMLIDAGFGRPNGAAEVTTAFGVLRGGALLPNLAQLGVYPHHIETVAVTHLHADHLGALWQIPPGTTTPALSRARVAVSAVDWHRPDLAAAHGTPAAMLEPFTAQVLTVEDGDELFPGVRALALPGHTLGHLGYDIRSRGQRLIAFGDAMHSDLQITHPDLACAADHQPAQAIATRHQLIRQLRQPSTLGFGVHFADRQFGQITTTATGRSHWEPVTD